MGVLDQNKLTKDVKDLLDLLEKSQWTFKTDFRILGNYRVINREKLRAIKMVKGIFTSKTTGSTGEPVSVEKTYADYVWYLATNIREMRWRKWDVTKNIAVISAKNKRSVEMTWGIPKEIEPKQGMKFSIGLEPISSIQEWIEKINPHYIQAPPSVISQLDLTKIKNYIDHKGTGELGGSMYSSEECGTIAIQCPDNKNNYHVMENQIVEVDNEGAMIITTNTNNYIKRYKHGDHIVLGKCDCGRTLQTITKINGRVRNMFVLPNGDKKWPMIGSRDYYEKFGIKRYKAIQTEVNKLELHVIADNLKEREEELKTYVKEHLNSDIIIDIIYVTEFPNYKFEEFVSLVK